MTSAQNILSPGASLPVAKPPRRATRPATGAAAPKASTSQAHAVWWTGLAASLAWLALGVLTYLWPNKPAGFNEWTYTTEFAVLALAVAALL
ncbi:MAG: ABC transporter permease, partial [Pseudomonadota bacterium]